MIENYKPSFEIKEDWELITLRDLQIIDGDRGINYPNKNDFSNNDYCLFLNTKNVRKDGFLFEDLIFISKDKDEQLNKGKLSLNDIVLTTRGTIGNIGFYDESIIFKNVRINSGMVILRIIDTPIIPKYLYFILQSNYVQNQFSNITSGAAQPQLPIRDLNTVFIPLPPIEEQQKIVDEYLKEQSTINGAKALKTKMELKIKEVIDKVW